MSAASSGGSGGESGRFTTRDSRLVARALKEAWDIPPETRKAMVKRLGSVIGDPQAAPRSFFTAAKIVSGLSRNNLAAIDSAIRATEHEELLQRIAELEASSGGRNR